MTQVHLINEYPPEYFQAGLIRKLSINSEQHPVKGWLRSYASALKKFDFVSALAICKHLLRLEQELAIIEGYNTKTFQSFKRLIQQDSNYAGARFEVSICSRLIRSGLIFRLGRSVRGEADFYITRPDDRDLIFECAAFNILRARNFKDLLDKFKRKIVEKKFKPYVSKNTFLLVDITNIASCVTPFLAQEEIAEENLTRVFADELGSVISGSGYAGAVFFITSFCKRGLEHKNNWSKIYFGDSSAIHEATLSRVFPNSKGNFIICEQTLFPRHG